MAEESCACETTSVMVLACSGGSNVGQIANAAAIEMARQGQGRFYCLAGIGAHIGGMVDSAVHVDYRIAIDGCPTACARRVLEHAGVPIERAVVVTQLGIAKNHDLEWSYDEIDRTVAAALEGAPVVATASSGCGCGCVGDCGDGTPTEGS